MGVDDGGEAEEHEDDRLAEGGQQLHEVLDRALRLARHVRLHVVPHADTAERQAETQHGIRIPPNDRLKHNTALEYNRLKHNTALEYNRLKHNTALEYRRTTG